MKPCGYQCVFEMQGKDSLFLGPGKQSRKQSQPLALSVPHKRMETAASAVERVLHQLKASLTELKVIDLTTLGSM